MEAEKMKVKEMAEKLGCKILTGEEGLDKDVEGVYVSDLLSWVMSHGNKSNVWITVQIHPNVVAVATLLEFSCILVPEGIEVEKVTIEKAIQEKIPVLQAMDSAYTLCGKLKEFGI